MYTPDSRDVSCAISGDGDSWLRSVTDIEAPRRTRGKKKKTSDTPTSVGRCSRSIRVVVPKPITMYLDKVISTSERGITGNVNKREVDVVH